MAISDYVKLRFEYAKRPLRDQWLEQLRQAFGPGIDPEGYVVRGMMLLADQVDQQYAELRAEVLKLLAEPDTQIEAQAKLLSDDLQRATFEALSKPPEAPKPTGVWLCRNQGCNPNKMTTHQTVCYTCGEKTVQR